jgi:transposase InsO family protein
MPSPVFPQTVGIEPACAALGVARASYYRQRPLLGPSPVAQLPVEFLPRPTPARALCADERQTVRAVLNSERFQDCSPAAVNATLLDEAQYLCSTRTMYRILEENGATRERRDQLTHPQYQKPELLSTAPNQLWSWDITKLRGPAKWTYFYLIVSLGSKRRCEISTVVVARRLWKRLRQAARRRPCVLCSASASPLLRITLPDRTMTPQRASSSGMGCFQNEFSDVVWCVMARPCYKAFAGTKRPED